MRIFKLNEEQVEFLKNNYKDNDLVQKVLVSEKDGTFEIDVNTEIDFMDYLEDDE